MNSRFLSMNIKPYTPFFTSFIITFKIKKLLCFYSDEKKGGGGGNEPFLAQDFVG